MGLSASTGCGDYVAEAARKISEEIKEIAWKAQQRLHERYRKLLAKGKNKGVVVTAVGRELLGFIWAIGIQVEQHRRNPCSGRLRVNLF